VKRQDFAYTYDAVGNLTQIANTANASSSATTVFTYDTLNRLLSASTTAADSNSYLQQYSYDNLGNILTFAAPYTRYSIAPSILDTLPLTLHSVTSATSDSFSYTVPSSGSNKLLVVYLCKGNSVGALPTATQNGASLSTFVLIPGTGSLCAWYYSYLAVPTTGTFQINFPAGATNADYTVMTLQDVAPTNPVETSDLYNNGDVPSTSVTASNPGHGIRGEDRAR
jgi:hypothetical protein